MKWPLKYQIMVPVTLVMLGTVVGMSSFEAVLAAGQTKRQIAQRIQDVTGTLARSSFPLTSAVLNQMKGLAGADFVLRDGAGTTVATTRHDWGPSQVSALDAVASPAELQLVAPISIGGERLFHGAVAVRPRGPSHTANALHVLYAEDVYLRERRRAVLPSLGIGGAAIAVSALLALVTASRVSRPLRGLHEQVNRIAHGDFQPISLPARRDEVRDLAEAVNHMAETLSDYEQQIRRTEQVRLLAQLGGGLAHQLRNSATGARMALDIHRSECPAAADLESLDVAMRQLVLMEKYLAKFLSLGSPSQRRRERIDFAELVRGLLPLVRPAARHIGVQLLAEIPQAPVWVCGDADALEHMVLNLLTNALDAAAAWDTPRQGEPGSRADISAGEARVIVRVEAAERVLLSIEDTGAGPPAEIAATLFEPFVTGKQDGIGLGLAVAREVAVEHRGSIRWERSAGSPQIAAAGPGDGSTKFLVELPLAVERTDIGNHTDR